MALPILASSIAKGLVGSSKKKPVDPQKNALAIIKRNEEDKKTNQKTKKSSNIVKVKSSNISFKKVNKPNIKKPNTSNEKLNKTLSSFQKGLSAIGNTLNSIIKQRVKGDKEKNKRKRNLGLRLKEFGFEKIGGVINLSKNLINKIPFIDTIKNFFTNILLGGIVVWLTKNIEKVVEEIEKFVEKIEGVFEKLNKFIFKPIFEAGKFLVDVTWPIIDGILKSPPVDAAVEEIKRVIGEIEKFIPGLESIKSEFEKLKSKLPGGSDIKSGGGQGSKQYDTSSGGLLASGGVEQGQKAKEQVSKAGFDESEFKLYRDVVAQIESGGKYDIQGGSGKMYAGRYQMGADAREDAARFLGETYEGDTEAARKKFREDPQMQERYFAAYTRANHETLMRLSPEYRELTKEGKLQVLGYAHNAGAGNAVDWLKSGMSDSFRDGFGTRSDKYSTSIRQAQERRRNVPPSEQAPGYSKVIPLQSKLPALPPTGTGGRSMAAAQQYGAPRDGGNRRHAGQDFDAGPNGTFYSRIGGEVIYSGNAGGGYGNVVDVYNKELGYTERVAEGDVNLVRKGEMVSPGTALQRGTQQTGVFHYEIRMGKAGASGSFEGTVNPVKFLQDLDMMVRQKQEQEQSRPPSENPPGVQPTSSQSKDKTISRSASYDKTRTVAIAMDTGGGGGGTIVSGGGMNFSNFQSALTTANTYYRASVIRDQYST